VVAFYDPNRDGVDTRPSYVLTSGIIHDVPGLLLARYHLQPTGGIFIYGMMVEDGARSTANRNQLAMMAHVVVSS